MSYTVLARVYRPQSFEEMTGQAHVVRTIEAAIRLDKVAHAFLFSGPRGVGKTTAARILARALNCEKGPTATPCGVCATCREIRDGTSTDVMEIDGASNNGVESVREIRENAKYLPQKSRYKIYIIDEVHMLSGAAFNALLKTLEEPPPHVKFIFATTEPQKLPDTILSRCQRHNFRRIGANEIVARLTEICTKESLAFPDAALALIATQASGGMRDAISLLDQVRLSCGNSPTAEDVAVALGVIATSKVHAIATALIARDSATLLEQIAALWNSGVDMKRVADEVALYLRHLFTARALEAPPVELSDADGAAALALAGHAELPQLARLFDIVHGAAWDVGRAAQPRAALEMAMLKAMHLSPAAAIPELVERLGKLAAVPQTIGAPGGGSEAPSFRPSRA